MKPCLSIEVKIGDNEVTISWIKPTKNEDGSLLNDLAGYYIYRSKEVSETVVKLNDEPVKGICFTDTNAINGITYYYEVTAVDYSGNESKKSPRVSAKPNILPPSRFKVKPGDGEVQLFWEPYEKSELKGYHVYRRNPLEKIFQRLTEIPIQEAYFIDTQVANGIAYFYKVSCVGIDDIQGLYSPVVGATPLAVIPEEPSSVHAKYIQEANGTNHIELTWEESEEDNIAGYRIYRRLLNESEFTLLTPTLIEETQYTDASINPDKGYLYSVVAVTERGMESQYPKEAKCFTSALYISSFTQDTGGKAKKAGDKICFCLRGEPGLLASYKVEGLTSSLPMEETSEGTYNACLEITEEMSVEEGQAFGFIEDPQGNRTSKAAEEILIIDNQPPNIVKNAKAEWDTGIVKITWEIPEGEFSGFEIFRDVEGSLEMIQVDGSKRLPIKTVSGDKTFCYDVSIKPDRSYYYSICTLDRAENSAGPLYLSPVYIPYQSGIPFIKSIHENTAGMPQKTGDRIEVELIGEEGCLASFFIPGIIEESIHLDEKAIGQYSGYYIVRPEDRSEEAVIQVCLKDDLGHTNCQNAASSLIINYDLEDANPPVIYDINHNAFEIAGFSGDLVPGNTLEIDLRGEAGCNAYFIITSSDSAPDMEEDEFEKHELLEKQDYPGLYTGTYTIGWDDESIEEAYIWACMSDRAGNKVWKHSEESITLDIRPRIKVIPGDTILWADQESQTNVSVKVTDANDDPVEGHFIAFSITTTDEYTGVVGGGDLVDQTSTDVELDFDHATDSWGEVETEYTSGFAAKTAIIVAKDLTTGHVGTGYVLTFIKAQTDIELRPLPSRARLLNAKPYKLILTADPDRITADGVSSSWIKAELTDRDGRPINKAGVLISFSLDDSLDDIENGRLSSYQVYTDSSGTAATRYTAGIIRGTVTITGSCPGFEAESGSTQISLMSDAPAIMELAANPDRLYANGDDQSTIKVWVADINENPVQEAMVEFSVLQDNRGTLSAITEATDFNGWAQCIYTSPRLYGQETTLAKILAKVTSKVPTEEELARAMGTIFIPLLHPEMEEEDEVKIIEWLFRKGDEIKQSAPIVRIDTQKGEYLLKAPVSGELAKITIHRGERVTLGESIGQILADEEYWEED